MLVYPSSYTVELHSRMVVARSTEVPSNLWMLSYWTGPIDGRSYLDTEFETFYTKNRRGDCSWLRLALKMLFDRSASLCYAVSMALKFAIEFSDVRLVSESPCRLELNCSTRSYEASLLTSATHRCPYLHLHLCTYISHVPSLPIPKTVAPWRK